MAAKLARQVIVYARLSVTSDESVSIERQIDAGRKYAEARGWSVVAEAVDDGVSASKFKPEDRAGWRSVIGYAGHFDTVVVWKVDRLARRVIDFLHADEALRARGADIVAVEDPLDMTTPQGRAFATMLASFGEMEAASISARVKAARSALIRSGRRAGGRTPFGWINVPNPDGPGKVLAKDPERIAVVIELVERAMAGTSIHSLARWLESEGVQPRARQGRNEGTFWHYDGVQSILRNPVLAGLSAIDGDVLRDGEGLPVVDESVAIISTEERRQLLATLDAAKKPGTRQKAGTEPALLYGLARCGTCGSFLHRALSAGKYRRYQCRNRSCERPAGVTREGLEEFVTSEILQAKRGKSLIEVHEDPRDVAPLLAEIEHAISETVQAMARDVGEAEEEVLAKRLKSLKARRTKARAAHTDQPGPVYRWTDEPFVEAWDSADGVEARRQLLMRELDAVAVMPGYARGRAFDTARVHIDWHVPVPVEINYLGTIAEILG